MPSLATTPTCANLVVMAAEPPTKISFTGTTSADLGEARFVRDCLDLITYPVIAVHTGAADGVDTLTFNAALTRWPDALHVVLYPDGLQHNVDVVREARRLPNGHAKPILGGDYMRRNDALVKACDVLIAFPATRRESPRSGTWATVRRARAKDRRIHVFPLDGTPPWTERI